MVPRAAPVHSVMEDANVAPQIPRTLSSTWCVLLGIVRWQSATTAVRMLMGNTFFKKIATLKSRDTGSKNDCKFTKI